MPKKKHQLNKSVFKKYNTLILLPLGTIILLTLCVIIFGLGLDSKLFDSSLEGYIFDVQKTPIAGADVCVQNRCVLTAENGFYQIPNLKLGNDEISVTSDKHLNLVESIKINSGVNTLSVELTAATLANVTVNFKDNNGLQISDLIIELEDKPITELAKNLDEKTWELKLVDKKTGLYKLNLESGYYVDQIIDLVIEPDIDNYYEINLEPASNFNINVQDWLNSTPLPNTRVSVRDDMEYITNENGLLSIEDFSVYENEILVSKDGFLKQTYPLTTLNPGVNPDLTIKLVPEGKITFVKETSLGKQIFLSNFDGSELHQLTLEGINTNPWVDQKNEKVYFLKNQIDKAGLVYWVDFLGDETKRISTKTDEPIRKIDLINYKKDLRVFLKDGETTKIVKTNLDDTQESTLYDLVEGSEVKESILSEDGSQFIFSFVSNDEALKAEEGIYTNNIRFNRVSNLIKFNVGDEKRISQPRAVNDDDNRLALTIEGELFVHGYSGEEIVRITNDSLEKNSFYFQPETNNISYIRTIEGRKELVLVNPDSKEMKILAQTDVEGFDYRWITKDLFNYIVDGELWISSINNLELAKLVDSSVTF